MELNSILLEAMSLLKLASFKLDEANELDPDVEQCVDLERLTTIRYEVADLLAVKFTQQ